MNFTFITHTKKSMISKVLLFNLLVPVTCLISAASRLQCAMQHLSICTTLPFGALKAMRILIFALQKKP